MHICLVCPSTLVWLFFQSLANWLFRVEKRVCGLTLLERGIHAYLPCLSEHARLAIFSVSHELTFPCGKACLWPHAFRTRYTCIFVFFVRARSFVSCRLFFQSLANWLFHETGRLLLRRVVTIRRLILPPLDLQCWLPVSVVNFRFELHDPTSGKTGRLKGLTTQISWCILDMTGLVWLNILLYWQRSNWFLFHLSVEPVAHKTIVLTPVLQLAIPYLLKHCYPEISTTHKGKNI